MKTAMSANPDVSFRSERITSFPVVLFSVLGNKRLYELKHTHFD